METNDMHSQRNDQWMQALREESARTTASQDAQMHSILRQADGMRQIRDQERYDALELSRRKRDAIESAIAMTPTDTGRLSPGMLKYLNAERGIETNDKDVQDGQIVEGGWIGDSGDYGFVVARKGADGTITPERRRFSRADVYGMASNRPDLYDAATVEGMGKKLQEADSSYLPAGRLLGLTAKHKASRDKLDEELNTARMNLGGRGQRGGVALQRRADDIDSRMKQQREVMQGMKYAGEQLSRIKQMVDENPEMDEETRNYLLGAYKNGVMQMAGMFYGQKGNGSGVNENPNVPTMSEDGKSLRLPDGTNVVVGQEYTDPKSGTRRKWNGGDPRNWTVLGKSGKANNGTSEVKPEGASSNLPGESKPSDDSKSSTGQKVNYSKIGAKTIGKFKTLFPEATDEEIGEGKYDKEIRRIANMNGDADSEAVFAESDKEKEERDKQRKLDEKIKRSQRYDSESGDIIKQVELESERIGVQNNWPQWKIDEYRKKQTDDRLEKLRRKIGMKRKFGGSWE